MALNKQTGNMYDYVTHTHNIVKGKCPHKCSYCYMLGFKVGELRLDRKEFNTNLGDGKFIFVGSSTDMFADSVPSEWIVEVLEYYNKYPDNKYLFQTKNPKRFIEFHTMFPPNTILGTTIETNRDISSISTAPSPEERMSEMVLSSTSFETMISIEPIMDFDVIELVKFVATINPDFVSIGADSKGSGLPEPSGEKIRGLIRELEKITIVKIKPNLKRLMA